MIVRNPVESILALAASVFEAYSIVLFDAPRDGQGAQIIAAYSQENHIDENTVITPGKGIVGWILRNNSPILVGSIDENHAYLGYYKEDWEPDVCSFLGCPLPGGGILCIDSRQQQAFSPEKQKLIAVFADVISQTQSMAPAVPSAETETDFLPALDRLAELRRSYPGWKSYLQQALPILLEYSGFQYAAFASRMEGDRNYIVEGENPAVLLKDEKPLELSVHNGIIGWVFRNEEAVFNNGEAGSAPLFGKIGGIPEYNSTICLPVVMNRNTCGVLCLASEEKMPISDALKKFVHLAADDLGRLLEIISLRYRLRQTEKALQNSRG